MNLFKFKKHGLFIKLQFDIFCYFLVFLCFLVPYRNCNLKGCTRYPVIDCTRCPVFLAIFLMTSSLLAENLHQITADGALLWRLIYTFLLRSGSSPHKATFVLDWGTGKDHIKIAKCLYCARNRKGVYQPVFSCLQYCLQYSLVLKWIRGEQSPFPEHD